MQSKGNIDILDETEGKMLPSRLIKHAQRKGNVDIIDETREKEEKFVTQSLRNGIETSVQSEDSSVTEIKEIAENQDIKGQGDEKQNKFGHSSNDKDSNVNEDSNGGDGDTNKSCNENNSFSVDGKVMSAEVSETESYSKDDRATSEDCLIAASIKECLQIINDHKKDKLTQQTEAVAAKTDVIEGATAAEIDVIPGSENSSPMSYGKASDVWSDPCDFCRKRSKFMCKFCSFFYCDSCLPKVHPSVGPYRSHKVIPVQELVRQEHLDRCKEHGLVAQLFCSYCELNRCTECVKTRCSLHFKGRVSAADIESEKETLVKELEKATTKLGFLEKYKENVQNQIDSIQFTGLLRREQIRQEFVSFHDLLIEKEAKMLEQLDQEVTGRVDHIVNTLQASVRSLEQEDARLTTTVTDLVQSGNDAKFIEEYVTAKDLCHQVDDKVSVFDREWAKNSIFTPSPLLDNHFTMIVEKKQLSDRLDATMEVPQLRFKQSVLFVESSYQPFKLIDFLEPPVVPTSTKVSFCMQLFLDGEVLYEKEVKKLQDLTLNSFQTKVLLPGKQYLLKLRAKYFRLASSAPCQDQYYTVHGDVCHMLIVTKKVTNIKKGRKKLSVVKKETK